MMSKDEIKFAIKALEECASIVDHQTIGCDAENAVANAHEAISLLKVLAEQPAQRKQVGDSRFERWYSDDFEPKGKGTKQQMREAYEAGMNDPSPLAQQEPVFWAISYDGKTPYALWPDGDGALFDLEIRRQGGTASKMPLYTSPPASKPLTIKQEQKAFEKWWIKEIGDKDDLASSNVPKFTPTFYAITRVEYAWQAWQARAIEAAHGIKEKNT